MTAEEVRRAWRVLPLMPPGGITTGPPLVLAPHPDDESLGCGGLIATCVAAGRAPLVVVLTDGAGSHPNSRAYPPDRLRAVRRQEVRDAMSCVGLPLDRIAFLSEPDTAAPTDGPRFDAVVAQLTGLIGQEPGCTAILASWRHDPHCDHEAASLIAAAVAEATGIRNVAYPVWGWTLPADSLVAGPSPSGWRLNVGAFQSAKQAAIQAHKSQYGDLITDDPTGFRLPPALLSVFGNEYETFIQP